MVLLKIFVVITSQHSLSLYWKSILLSGLPLFHSITKVHYVNQDKPVRQMLALLML